MKEIKSTERVYELNSTDLKHAVLEIMSWDKNSKVVGPFFWNNARSQLTLPGDKPEKVEFITKDAIEVTVPVYRAAEAALLQADIDFTEITDLELKINFIKAVIRVSIR